MNDSAGSDKFLLDRLNALKPTSITLGPVAKPDPSSTIEKAKPHSKEDALSDRLKSLRNQIDSEPPSSPGPELQLHPLSHGGAIHPSAPDTKAAQPQTSSTDGDLQVDQGISRDVATGAGGDEDIDPLLNTDDETLEDILAELRSDETWLEEVAVEEEDRHRQITALLEELGGPSTDNIGPEGTASHKTKRESHEGGSDKSSSDDDSEGDQMIREADEVLAKALDEIELERSQQPTPPAVSPPARNPASDTKGASAAPQGNSSGGDSFKLPTVPSQLQDQPTTTTTTTTADNDDDDDNDLSETDADFEASIAARMAALKVSPALQAPILPSVPASDVNALGLPGAPTFSPHDRPVPGLLQQSGFTDADQRSWCIVCLEDGAVRCLGCEDGDDVYCARCWKEMHVGPRVGYEERGHRWEKYVRPR